MDENVKNLKPEDYLLLRTKLWTPELDKLLRKWKKQINKREKGHMTLSRKYNRRHYILGIPATIFSALIATGVLATFRNCDPEKDDQCDTDQWVRFTVGMASLISTGVTALQTFMNYQSESEKHKSAADDYGSLERTIDTMLLVPGEIRGDPIASLQNIRSQYDDLVRRTPPLPESFDTELKYEMITPESLSNSIKVHQEEKNTPKKKSSSSQESEEEKMREGSSNPPSRKSSITKKNPNVEEDDNTVSSIEDIIAKENEGDTSDEEYQVKVPYDLESCNYYTPNTIIAAAKYASQKNMAVQSSLQQALNFELERLKNHTCSREDVKIDIPPKEKDDSQPKKKKKKK